MVARILWMRAFTGYAILVLLGIIMVLWIGLEIVMATHENEWCGKTLEMDIVGYIIGMLFGGVCLLIPIFIIAFIISLFVH